MTETTIYFPEILKLNGNVIIETCAVNKTVTQLSTRKATEFATEKASAPK